MAHCLSNIVHHPSPCFEQLNFTQNGSYNIFKSDWESTQPAILLLALNVPFFYKSYANYAIHLSFYFYIFFCKEGNIIYVLSLRILCLFVFECETMKPLNASVSSCFE